MEPTEKKIEVAELSAAEAEAEFGDGASEDGEETTAGERIAARLATPTTGAKIEGVPEWASIPPGFEIPPGKRCGWMLFRAEWTDAPAKGDRWCMMWPLSEAEQSFLCISFTPCWQPKTPPAMKSLPSLA